MGAATLTALLALTAGYGPLKKPAETSDGPPRYVVDITKVSNPVPRDEPKSHLGNKTYWVHGKKYSVMPNSQGYVQRGIASWYGTKFHKHKTSSGEPYDMFGMTAAHRNLPLPTYVRVTNLANKHSVIVKVNDRGPFHPNRIIDLSYTAAKKLGILSHGTGYVEVEALDPRHPNYFLADDIHKKKPKLYLQMAAFNQRSHALDFVDKLKVTVKDLPIYLSINQSRAKNIYKVLVGPFLGADQFYKLKKQVQYAGLGQGVAVLR